MEKKTMGAFIAALRRANGMTQRELADKLCVSDKTVSRWERDDGAPDISAIPAIAEIFGVTCDELLRGERKSAAQRELDAGENETTAKGERQRQYLLRAATSGYRSRTMIAMGVSAAGLIAALICNLAFLRAVLGFLVGAVFFAAGIICQAVFVNRAFLSVGEAEPDDEDAAVFKNRVIRLAALSVGWAAVLTGFTFPLALVPDAYWGLTAESMLTQGAIGAVVALVVYAVAWGFVKAALVKKGVYTMDWRETAVYLRNRKLKVICAAVLAVCLTATCVLRVVTMDPELYVKGTVFEDYKSFVEFMETETPGPYNDPQPTAPQEFTFEILPGGEENGPDEEPKFTITDKNGKVVCEYTPKNKSVYRIDYTDQTILPITVYTRTDLHEAGVKVELVGKVFLAVCILEIGAAFLVYFKKRAK